MLLLVSALVGGRVIQRATGTIAVSADELIVLAFAFALSWSMYAAGRRWTGTKIRFTPRSRVA